MAEGSGGKHNVDMDDWPEGWTVDQANKWLDDCKNDLMKGGGRDENKAIAICKARAKTADNLTKPSEDEDDN